MKKKSDIPMAVVREVFNTHQRLSLADPLTLFVAEMKSERIKFILFSESDKDKNSGVVINDVIKAFAFL
mgnify:CR=1 FL=1